MGRVDPAQRGRSFLPPFQNSARTLSIPGTANEIITAASYITKGAGVGSISSFSSLGPTRDGRSAPTVAAPGEQLMAPQPASTGDAYGLMGGTSMASPMVAGTVALMLQTSPGLTQAEAKDCLQSTARSDAFTGTLPEPRVGRRQARRGGRSPLRTATRDRARGGDRGR